MNRLRLCVIFHVCLLASLYAALRMAWCIAFSPQKAWMMASAHDQLANAATNGRPNETISSRANRARLEGRLWGCRLCAILNWFDQDHCRKSAVTKGSTWQA